MDRGLFKILKTSETRFHIYGAIKRSGLAVVLASSFLLSTCSTGDRLPGYVYYRIGNDPTALDPALIVDVNGGAIAAKLYNGLVRLDPGLEIIPDIAERYSVSDDGLVYKFKLRKGVRFSNGREVKAQDFKFSFERVLDPDVRSPQTWLFENIQGAGEFMLGKATEVRGIRIKGDYGLEIRLKKSYSAFLGLLTMPAAYVVPMEDVLYRGHDFPAHPVGTGPFVLKEWLPSSRLVLAARDDYFGGRAGINGIVYRVIPEELTSVAEFELGNLDIISIPSSEYSRYINSPKWGPLISTMNGLNTYYLGMNCETHPFKEPSARKAAAHAIDIRKILSTIYESRGAAASGPVPDILRSWRAPDEKSYDPKMSNDLLRNAKASGAEVDFYITADQQVVDIAEVIQSYMNKAGFKVRIHQLEWSAFKEAVNNGEADMFWLSWWADYPDAENFLFPTFHSTNHGAGGNRARYTNKEVDRLIEAGQQATSSEQKNKYYERAERLIAEDSPWVFFWHKTDAALRQPWVKSYSLNPVYSMDKGLDIKL